MADKAAVRALIGESLLVKQRLMEDEDVLAGVVSLAGLCVSTLEAGRKIIFAGNGGSFADAQHLSTEFASRFELERAPLASLALGTNNATISAIANDYGYAQVFAREIMAIGAAGDLFIPISTSGNSQNLVTAIGVALRQGLAVMGLTGSSGGRMATLCNCVRVPSSVTPHIQESHIMLGHIICGLTEASLFPSAEDREI